MARQVDHAKHALNHVKQALEHLTKLTETKTVTAKPVKKNKPGRKKSV